MSVTPDDLSFLQTMQQRILNEEQIPRDDLRKAIEIARRWRSAPSASKAVKSTSIKKATHSAVSMDDINAMFESIGKPKAQP